MFPIWLNKITLLLQKASRQGLETQADHVRGASQSSALQGQNPFDQGLVDKCNLLHLETAQDRDIWMSWEQDMLPLQWHFAAPATTSGFWSGF